MICLLLFIQALLKKKDMVVSATFKRVLSMDERTNIVQKEMFFIFENICN